MIASIVLVKPVHETGKMSNVHIVEVRMQAVRTMAVSNISYLTKLLSYQYR